jgi:hypothetical protein
MLTGEERRVSCDISLKVAAGPDEENQSQKTLTHDIMRLLKAGQISPKNANTKPQGHMVKGITSPQLGRTQQKPKASTNGAKQLPIAIPKLSIVIFYHS